MIVAGALAGCTDRAPAPVPLTEFIVVAADSVFWVRAEAEGIRIRSAPMLLAQLDGRFHELYVTDEDHSYYDATFLGQRLYARDLISGDSTLLLRDTVMATFAAAYGRANPDERPLTADEEGAEEHRIVGTTDIGILDVHGPWVSVEVVTDLDVVGARPMHGVRQGVVDLRSGRRGTLTQLFGASTGARLAAWGRDRWAVLRDSLERMATAMPDGTGIDLTRLTFDPTSFHLDVDARRPVVHFTAVQERAEDPIGPLSIDTMTVAAPAWWEAIAADYPDTSRTDERRWTREGLVVRARPTGTEGSRLDLTLVDSTEASWPLGTVPTPVHRLLWLDPAVAGDSTRTALTRAFNEAALYSEEARVVSSSRKGMVTSKPSLARWTVPVNASRASRPRSLASRE